MLIEIYLYFILFLIIFRYSTLVVDDIRSSVSKFPHRILKIMSTWNQNQTYSLFAPMGNYILNVNKDLHHSLKKYSS
ncbi:hypothetical protein C8R48DRAFT_740430 [Suillus tomentosus]|nr:hypothetical protein C8R48DRAFT_740430 [Suillus tomentosus]